LCTGSIATSFSASVSGTYSMKVNAGGQYGVGAWPHMQLIVDGVVQGSWDVAVWAPTTNAYTASVNLNAGSHTFAVAFVNDAYDPSNPFPDRNLYISTVVITAPPVAAEYTYSCPVVGGAPGDHWELVVAADGSKFVESLWAKSWGALHWTYEWDFHSKTDTSVTYAAKWWNGPIYASLPLSALNGVGGFADPGSTGGTCR
jgi:hypothetical protein